MVNYENMYVKHQIVHLFALCNHNYDSQCHESENFLETLFMNMIKP